MNVKPRIFIGSSAESKEFAEVVSRYLGRKYECVVWSNCFFDLNATTYETLARKAIIFDYAVYIGGKDDFVIRKQDGSTKYAPRDNVYLEFGLYAGILSPARSFFLVHKACRIATDLLGVTVALFHDKKSIQACCKQADRSIERECRKNRIQLLPSTSLAMGYYTNFLCQIKNAVLDRKDNFIDGWSYDEKKKNLRIEVVLPDDVYVDWQSWADRYAKHNGLCRVSFNGSTRTMGILMDKDTFDATGVLRVMDIPQTLRASFAAVDLVLGQDYLGEDEVAQLAKENEVRNFCATLKNLIKKDAYLSEIVEISMVNAHF